MDSTHAVGLVLVGLSAALLAGHWQQSRDARSRPLEDRLRQQFCQSQIRRRTWASSLLGLLGVALTVQGQVPRSALWMSSYLFGLIILACAVFSLGLLDLVATRRFGQREQIDRLAEEFRRARLGPAGKKSIET